MTPPPVLLVAVLAAALGRSAAAQDAGGVTLDPHQPAATAFGFTKFPLGADVHVPGLDIQMSYLMLLPHAYVNSKARQPLLIFLHGNSHQGSDLAGLMNEGPAHFLQGNAEQRGKFPMVGLFPQCPVGMRWDTPGMSAALVGLIDRVIATYRIDPDRVYLTGLSMGGKGAWMVADAAPDRFAMIVPISAIAVDPQPLARKLKHTATWIICGANDGNFTEGSRHMAGIFEQEGADSIKLTVVANEGHGIWGHFYYDMSFYQTLLKMRRHQHSAAQPATRAVR